jgi:hypothetical protein
MDVARETRCAGLAGLRELRLPAPALGCMATRGNESEPDADIDAPRDEREGPSQEEGRARARARGTARDIFLPDWKKETRVPGRDPYRSAFHIPDSRKRRIGRKERRFGRFPIPLGFGPWPNAVDAPPPLPSDPSPPPRAASISSSSPEQADPLQGKIAELSEDLTWFVRRFMNFQPAQAVPLSQPIVGVAPSVASSSDTTASPSCTALPSAEQTPALLEGTSSPAPSEELRSGGSEGEVPKTKRKAQEDKMYLADQLYVDVTKWQ